MPTTSITFRTINDLADAIDAPVRCIDVSRPTIDSATKAIIPTVPNSRLSITTTESGYVALRDCDNEVFTSAKGAEYKLQARVKGDPYVDAQGIRQAIRKSHASFTLQKPVALDSF